jgi:hypothetical protein
MGIAPNPQFPENGAGEYVYERKIAENRVGNRGPLRFEEGVATDTDIPNDFQRGMVEAVGSGYGATPVNPEIFFKRADQTTAERAHVGSASWIEAPTFLGEFAQGAGEPEVETIQVNRSGGRTMRHNPVQVEG